MIFQLAYDQGTKEQNWEPVNESRIMYQTADDIEHAVLVVNVTVMEDRGWYNCTAQNRATEFNPTKYKPSTTGTFVRVRGKYFNY